MDPWRTLVLQAQGLKFFPDKVGLRFVTSFAPGSTATFGTLRGQQVAYGGALYRAPDNLASAERAGPLMVALTHIAEVMNRMRSAGADDFILRLNRSFHGRCNEEFSRDELRVLASLDCDLFYTARDEQAPAL